MPTFYRFMYPTLNERRLVQAGLGCFFRPSQIDQLGITYDQLRRMEAQGTVERVARGLYRLASVAPTERYSIASVCARVPNSIVCLLSALQVHEIGTQLPRGVWIAIRHKARAPKVSMVNLHLLRFSGAAWNYGIQDMHFEGVPSRITSPARTVVDCFRFERLIGREAALEALHYARDDGTVTNSALQRVLDVLPSRRLSALLEAGA